MATPFSLSNYNRYKATINPAWPHPPEYNPTPAQTAGREAQVRQQFKAIDAKHAAALEAERRARAAEEARFRKQGGQYGKSGLYVSPQGNYLDPALEAQVARNRGNNVRPSPATVNMAPVAKPVAPKAPGRGMTYEEAYGPGSTVVAERIAEEKLKAKQRAMMQAGINKVNKATPKPRKATGPSQMIQGLQMLVAAQQAQMGQYGTPAAPAAPAAPRSGGWPATPLTPSPAAGVAPPSPSPVPIIQPGNFQPPAAPTVKPKFDLGATPANPLVGPASSTVPVGTMTTVTTASNGHRPRPIVSPPAPTQYVQPDGLQSTMTVPGGFNPTTFQPQGQYAPPPVAPQQAPAAAPALGPSEEYLKTLSPTGRAMAKTFVNAAAENGKEFGPDGKIRDYAPQPQGQYGPAPPSEIGSYAQTTSGGSPAFVDSSGKQYPIIKQKIGKSDRTSLTIVKDGKTYVMEQDGNGRWVTAWEIKKSK